MPDSQTGTPMTPQELLDHNDSGELWPGHDGHDVFTDVPATYQAALAVRALRIARGEIPHRDLARFPQILVAPALIAVIWQSLFSKHGPLDVTEMLRVHLDLIFGERRTT